MGFLGIQPRTIVEHLSTAITLIPLIQCPKFCDFLKAWKNTFQMVCFNQKFRPSPNLWFFGFGPWAIIYGTAKLANTFISQIWTLMIPSKRHFSKLLENPKMLTLDPTEFKLWQLKEIQRRGWGCSWTWWSNVKHVMIFWKLRRDLSNDVVQSKFSRGHNLSFSR